MRPRFTWPLALSLAAVLLLGAVLAIRYWPQPAEPANEGEHDHDHDLEHGGYLLFIEPSLVDSVLLEPVNGDGFTITANGDGFYLDDKADPEELAATALYAATLTYYDILGKPQVPLADYGLEPPLMRVTVNGTESYSIGNETLDGYARYVLKDGQIYVVDIELTGQLMLPRSAYRLRELWPGEVGDRPALRDITLEYGGEVLYRVVRNDLTDDAPLGLSRYELAAPVEFACNDSSVREKILNGLMAVDLDLVAEDVILDVTDCRIMRLIGDEGFEKTLYIGGTAPEGGRYLMVEGDDAVYIDLLGDYGFLDARPLDLTYGLAFWLIDIDDTAEVVVTDKGTVRRVPEGTADINYRRFYSHVLNFSVAAMAGDYGAFDRSVRITMADGTVYELEFAQQNERQLAVSVGGREAVFACNIKDWQQIIEDLDNLDAGKGIRE